MANRQHGGRSSGGRSGRTVPISRSPAGGRRPSGSRSPTGGRGFTGRWSPAGSGDPAEGWAPSGGQAAWGPSQPGVPTYIEPEVRRWPHPMEAGAIPPASPPEPALHYIRCALSYQNQLLADVKALLEQIAASAPPAAEPENADPNLSKL